MNALMRGSRNLSINVSPAILVTQEINLYSHLRCQFFHDWCVIDHLFMGEEVSFPPKIAPIIKISCSIPICKTTSIVVAVSACKDIVREFMSHSNSPNEQLLRLVVGRRSSQFSIYYGTPKRIGMRCSPSHRAGQRLATVHGLRDVVDSFVV